MPQVPGMSLLAQFPSLSDVLLQKTALEATEIYSPGVFTDNVTLTGQFMFTLVFNVFFDLLQCYPFF